MHHLYYVLLSLICHVAVSAKRGKLTIGQSKLIDMKTKSSPDSRIFQPKIKLAIHSRRPNIVLILTDDQDKNLGSMKHMPKTLRIMRDGGAEFDNAYVTTPMCCPSRSTLLTGMYVHNHNVYTNNDNCSSIQWQQTHETKNFATYLSNSGYRTGYFGKYLNEYNGTYIPPGWREWAGLIRNSRFYNYSINFNGKKIQHKDNYYRDYLTDLIANDSITFLRQSKEFFSNLPVMMVLSVPAPHGPEDSAPQYQHMFQGNTDHRTPAWNYAPNPDKQWLLQVTDKMQPIHQRFTDLLQQKRLQTLQSVDDMVEKVYRELTNLGELDNTYIMFTSDHGYHLGQYGLLKGKAMAFETDIKVPLYIRGPNIKPKSKVKEMVANIDLAPTFLAMAGLSVPVHMDGISMLPLLHQSTRSGYRTPGLTNNHPRHTVLIERGKITKKKMQEVRRMERKIIFDKMRFSNNSNAIPLSVLETVLSKKEIRLARLCSLRDMSPPCKPDQRHVCIQQPNGDLRLKKCSNMHTTTTKRPPTSRDDECICSRVGIPPSKQTPLLSTRSTLNKPVGRYRRQSKVAGPVLDINSKCQVLANKTVFCDNSIYQDEEVWHTQKELIDNLIDFYKGKLMKLKDIRKHLKGVRPSKATVPQHVPDRSDYIIGYRDVTGVCKCDRGYEHKPQNTFQSDIVGARGMDDLLTRLASNYTRQGALRFDEFTDDIFSRHGSIRERKQRLKGLKKRLLRLHKKNKLCKRSSRDCFSANWESLMRYIRHNRKRFKHPNCWQVGYECNVMDNEHWRTPPYWTLGPFCFCSNSNNNTYWCLRTINATHNFLYCEYITKFISYYDIGTDPHQLQNAAHDLNYGVLQQLHEQLSDMRRCRGAAQCNLLHKEKLRKKAGRQRADGSRRSQTKKQRRQWRNHKPRRYG